VQLTANVFYSDYDDMQLSYDLTPANPTDFSFIVRNAPKAETYGAEVGATAALTQEFSIYGSIGLLHAKITEYPGSGFQGNELPLSSSPTASMGVAFTRDRWDASFNARYSGSYYTDVQNNPRGNVDPYWLANAQLGYRWDRLRVYGSVNNVFDSGKPIAIYSGSTPAQDGASILAPRSYWLGAQWSW
jgi:outer membrane receptor protein involved in Fe transport